ncbi:MAG: hypothetical protein H0U57_10855 [Tatlockia sp.]|nr:hypothetical protein [Tatlockia sp.]
MNHQKKELLESINELESRIKLNKYAAAVEKRYFSSLFDRNFYKPGALLFPALMLGWRGGKKIRGKAGFGKFIKFVFMTFFNVMRTYKKLMPNRNIF